MARGVWVDRCGDRGATASCESEWESILVGTNKVAFSGYKMQEGDVSCTLTGHIILRWCSIEDTVSDRT